MFPFIIQRAIAAAVRRGALVFFALLATAALAAEPTRRLFDIPAGEAVATLKAFSLQSESRLLYSVETVKGVRTNEVRGTLTPREALARMVAATGLVVAESVPDGALALSREGTERPNALRADGLNPGAPTPAGRGSDEAVVLSPFEVNTGRDIDYTAASSMGGGRIDTELKNTPSALSILTREFLDDIGANSFDEAVEWSPNTVGIGPDTTFQEFGATVRGLRGNAYPTRNYFRWYVNSDSFTTERLEFARGPNSILFGDGSVSGVQTTWTKRARFKNSASLQTRFDSVGSVRGALDVNRVLSDRLALRLATVYDRGESWRDHIPALERQGIYLAGTWKVDERTQLRFDAEAGTYLRPIFAQSMRDVSSSWDRTTIYNGTGTPATANTGVARMNSGANDDYLVWTPAAASRGLVNWRGFYRTTGTNLNLLPNGRPDLRGAGNLPVARFPELPSREFSLQGRQSVTTTDYHSAELFLDRRFGRNLYLELAGNLQHVLRTANQGIWRDHSIDLNTVLPGGGANPNFGKAFADVNPARQTQQNDIVDFRLSGSYHWVLPARIDQQVSVIVGQKREDFQNKFFKEARANGTNPNRDAATNAIFHRVYWDDPRENAWGLPPEAGGVRSEIFLRDVRLKDDVLTYLQAAAVGRYFNGRLSSILGYRTDKYSRESWLRSSVTADGTPVLAKEDDSKLRVQTWSAGFVYYLVRPIGLYLNVSETFNAPQQPYPTLSGAIADPSRGEGYDTGLKINLLDGKIAGSIGYFDNRDTGRAVVGPSVGDINEIWRDLARNEREISGNYTDLQTFEARGWEVDLTASPTKGLKLLANYGVSRTRQIDTLPGLRGYYAQHLAAWSAGAADPANPNRARIAQNISDIQRSIEAAQEGRRLDGTIAYTANFFADYTLQQGRAKGLSMGVGTNVRGRMQIGNRAGAPFDYLYAAPHALVTAKLGYRKRIRDRSFSVQLNVFNVLDEDKLIFSSYSSFQGADVPNNFRYLDPRKFTLTTTVGF